MTRLSAILIAVVPLLFSAAIVVAGNSLFGTLLAVRLDLDGIAVTEIGLILTCYSLGWVAGALAGPPLINRAGHIRAFAALAALAAAAALIHPLLPGEWLWAGLRGLTGFCMAGLYTIIESWLNAKAPNEMRGKAMSAYMVVNFVAFGIGQYLLTVGEPAGFELFSLVAILLALSLVPLTLARVETPPQVGASRFGLRRLVEISPLGVAGCFAAGFVNGAFFAMGPVYARSIAGSSDWIAVVMMVVIFSGLVLQFPIGHLSDVFDRRKVVLGLALLLTAVSLAIALFGAGPLWALLVLLSLYGGTAYTIYPISLAHANDFLSAPDLIPAAAGLLLCFGIGAVLGPTLSSQVMAIVGPTGLFLSSAGVAASLALFTLYRMSRRPPVPNEAQSQYVAVLNTTGEAAYLDPRAEPEEEQLVFDFGGEAGRS